jgi:hypothetical protein
MKRKKTVTPAALAANSKNAKRSTGPQTDQGREASKSNAVKHGLTACKLHFSSEEEEAEFIRSREEFRADLQPKGILQRVVVDEIAVTHYKLGIADTVVTKGLTQLQKCDSNQIQALFFSKQQLPIGSWQLPLENGWACERLLVRASSGRGEEGKSGWSTPKFSQLPSGAMLRTSQNESQTAKNDESRLEIDAVLENAFSTVTRYQAALKRDLYRAIEMLRTLQAPAREKNDS